MDAKSFKEIITEQLQHRGLTMERLASLTGITDRHLRALLEGRVSELPSSPYVRGYVVKIASILELQTGDLWKIYREEVSVPTSGPEDRLPSNRYAIRPVRKGLIVTSIITLVVLGYVGVNLFRFFGPPELTIENPSVDNFVSAASIIMIAGFVNPSDKLTIDGEEITLDAIGHFERPYELRPGVNQIEFVVKTLLRDPVTTVRRVIYEPSETEPKELPSL